MKMKYLFILPVIVAVSMMTACDTVFNDVYDETNRSQLYVGGAFTSFGYSSRSSIASFDAPSGELTDFYPKTLPTGVRISMVVAGDYLYCGFNSPSYPNIYKIDIRSGAVSVFKNVGAAIYTMETDGRYIYIGGGTFTIDGQSRPYFASIELSTGALTQCKPALSNQVNAIAVSGNTVFIGGLFTLPKNFIAAIDKDTGTARAWDAKVNSGSSSVEDIKISGDTLYFCGAFSIVNGTARLNAASVNLATAELTSWNPGANTTVNIIFIDGDTAYLGGLFTSIGGQVRNAAAAVNKYSGALLDWDPNLYLSTGARVNAIAVVGDKVYVGGDFSNVGGGSGPARQGIAAFTSNATARLLDWDPQCSGSVYRLLILE